MSIIQELTMPRKGLSDFDSQVFEPDCIDPLCTSPAIEPYSDQDLALLGTNENEPNRLFELSSDENSDFDESDNYGVAIDEDPTGFGMTPRQSVESWQITAYGRRPMDFMARDCLFASLLRDYRATWFHRYLRNPAQWMKDLVGVIDDKVERAQRLQCIVLHYLHKLHLARLYQAYARPEEYSYDPEDWMLPNLRRLWACPPYGLQYATRNRGPMPHCCNLPRLCPWCHARKVLKLCEWIRRGPLKESKYKWIVFGKMRPFIEPMGGLDEAYTSDDELGTDSYFPTRRYYYGTNRDRIVRTRNELLADLLANASQLGIRNGLWTHQLGSAQIITGSGFSEKTRRTFVHDLGLIGLLDVDALDRIEESGDPTCAGYRSNGLAAFLWLPLDTSHPSALRVALAGSSLNYDASGLELPRSFFQKRGANCGIPGALSWQPTFLFDQEMWGAYGSATKGQHLYHPFGSWRESLSRVVAKSEYSVDRRFREAQSSKTGKQRQQSGNKRRGSAAADRREGFLKVARPLWLVIVKEPHSGRGRPKYRQKLVSCMADRGIELSCRDLKWLVKRLGEAQVSLKV